MAMAEKRLAAAGMALSILLLCVTVSSSTDNVFRQSTPHAPNPGPYLHSAATRSSRPNARNPATPLDGHASGHYLFFHSPNFRQDNTEEESSTSSSEKGKTDTTSDSEPSSTNDSSFEAQEEEESSTSSSVKGKTDTTSDSEPSSTNDSSFPNQGDSEDENQSSGSSTPGNESDNTSDSQPSSTDDSSMNSDGVGDEEQSEETPSEDDDNRKSETCQVATNGNFGTTSSGGRGLQYFFQMETPASVNENIVNNVLLPLVELGIAGRLLSLLFDDCRNSTNTTRSLLRRRSLQTTNSSCEPIGFSNLPVDRVLSGVPCVGRDDDSSNNCYVIDAGGRLYFDSSSACPDAANRSKAELKQAMDSGAFNDLERRILNISYVEESELELTSTDKTVQSSGGSSSETLPAWAWALIAIGGFFVILMCCYLCIVKRNQKLEEDEMRTPLGQGDDGDIDYEPPHSEHENPYYDSEAHQSEDSDPPERTTDDESMLPPMEETSGEDTD